VSLLTVAHLSHGSPVSVGLLMLLLMLSISAMFPLPRRWGEGTWRGQ
jgi:hypothetical protein